MAPRRNLVIVESAAKAKTIQGYLNGCAELGEIGTFRVKACFGHIDNLPLRELGVDTATWTATYEISADKRKVVAELRAAVKDAEFVYIASDNDLEGECIAAHLRDALKLKESRYARVTFNEITRGALKAAILAPRAIDAAKVEAQETRRILDRVTGYGLSPLLWRRFPGAGGPPRKSRGAARGGGGGSTALSAGRVQSAALRMVADRARAAGAHEAQKYWTLSGEWSAGAAAAGVTFRAAAETAIYEPDEARAGLAEMLAVARWSAKFKKKIVLKAPPLPFTTSTLQQEAHARFRLSAKDTMRVAQGLYEAGAITYMRTDSVAIAEEAIAGAAAYVRETYSAEDVCERPGRRSHAPGAGHAQEAHEAIRPTNLRRREAPGGCDGIAAKLYDLIWRRTVASQMAPARYAEVHAVVSADAPAAGEDAPGPFVGKVRLLLDPGYQKVLHSEIGCEKIESATESLKAWDAVIAAKAGGTAYALRFAAEGDVTRPATLFQEGTLVKAMEREGIGRPSTYAGILDKLFSKGYVCKEKPKAEDVEVSGWEADAGAGAGTGSAAVREVTRSVTLAASSGAADRLAPTGLGERVADYLAGVVPDLLDAGFTARMEADLDKIADKHGGMSKVTLLEKFYGELQAAIARASAAAASDSAAASDAGSDSAATPTKRRGAAKKTPAGPTVLREFAGGVRAVETRYGPALLVGGAGGAGGAGKAKGRFVALAPFMAWRGAELSEVSEADVARLAELPDEIAGADGWALAIGQYGLYLKRDRENRRLPEALWEEAWAGRLSGEAALGVLDAPVSPASPKRFTKKRSGVKRKV
jgi:DNA topoisomerase-1